MHALVKWWLRQLRELLPGSLVKASAKGSDAAILDVDQDNLSLLIRRRGQSRPVRQVRVDRAGFQEVARVIASQREVPRALLLRIPAATALRKELSLPIAAEGNLETLLGFEMDRETPFAKDEVYWGYRVRRRDAVHGRIDVDLVIVPYPAVASLLDSARHAGLDPIGIEVETAADARMLVRLGPAATRRPWRPERSTAAIATAACVLLAIALAIPFIRQRQALSAVNEAVASLTIQAEEAASLRKSIDRISETARFLDKEHERTGDALTTLAVLSTVLPDDTHLTALNVHAGKATVTGESPAAAKLIGLFAAAPNFREPAFVSPVVQSENDGLESFTISVGLVSAGAS